MDGIAQMRRRPMRPLLDALRALGVRVRCLGAPGSLAFAVRSIRRRVSCLDSTFACRAGTPGGASRPPWPWRGCWAWPP
ncbi:MAG: hypothetical protein ACK5IH_08935 [Betaproteobacteria bacterium]